MGILYVVATSIGNLEDMTLRALRILGEVSLIAAEDTRISAKLLNHYDIHTPVTSYFEHNELAKLDRILGALETGDVALISDAGTPGVSDPGYKLIREAVARGFRVVVVPGASAVIAALVASGLPTDRFVFEGFVPRTPNARKDWLESLAREQRTIVAYESPHRLIHTLHAVENAFGPSRQVVVARELTKMFEEIWRGSAKQSIKRFKDEPPRGEITLVIEGAPAFRHWSDEEVLQAMRERLKAGDRRKDAARAIAELSGWSSRDIYRLSLDLS